MTPESVMTDEWNAAADDAGGWRLCGVDHSQVVVLRKARSELAVTSVPVAAATVVDPPWSTSRSRFGCATRDAPTRPGGTSPVVDCDSQPFSTVHLPTVLSGTKVPEASCPPTR